MIDNLNSYTDISKAKKIYKPSSTSFYGGSPGGGINYYGIQETLKELNNVKQTHPIVKINNTWR